MNIWNIQQLKVIDDKAYFWADTKCSYNSCWIDSKSLLNWNRLNFIQIYSTKSAKRKLIQVIISTVLLLNVTPMQVNTHVP